MCNTSKMKISLNRYEIIIVSNEIIWTDMVEKKSSFWWSRHSNKFQYKIVSVFPMKPIDAMLQKSVAHLSILHTKKTTIALLLFVWMRIIIIFIDYAHFVFWFMLNRHYSCKLMNRINLNAHWIIINNKCNYKLNDDGNDCLIWSDICYYHSVCSALLWVNYYHYVL